MSDTPRSRASQPRTCVIASGRPWNRGMADSLHERTGIEFVSITEPAELTAEALEAIDPSYVFLPHWSHRIDASVYDRFECVIFHMTDLPFGRGGSPLQNLIARGFDDTRISALRCVGEMDAGPVYLKRDLSLLGSAEEIYLRASRIMEEMIVELLSTSPAPVPQSGEPTLFKRRRPDEGDLIEATTLDRVFDMIRMLDAEGYPKAFLRVGPFKLAFSRASRKSEAVVADVEIALAEESPKGAGRSEDR